MRQGFPLGVVLLTGWAVIGWDTAGAATDWRANRLTPLTKITVGPADNFEATVARDDGSIYFTQSRNLIPQIYRQDPAGDRAEPLLDEGADAKDPALAPGAERLAVTYFKEDAKGDVCLVPLDTTGAASKPPRCVTDSEGFERSPFWIGSDQLGYLTRPALGAPWRLVAHDLASGETTELHRGNPSGPAASPDGRYIAFNESMGDDRGPGLRLFDRQTGELIDPAPMDLPGITGFVAFGPDGRSLYLARYLNDTSLDQVIDGSDHSVIFRVPVRRLLEAEAPILPEQLTSVRQNCTFPTLSDSRLYMTCAFEGSLDVYAVPQTGTVPQAWGQAKLWEAHRVARTHEARLLLLNTLRYRHDLRGITLIERLLSHHLEIGEVRAALYYVGQIQDRLAENKPVEQPRLQAFYRILAGMLRIRAEKLEQPEGIITARFRQRLAEIRDRVLAELPALADRSTLMAFFEAYVDFEQADAPEALQHLETVSLDGSLFPMERYLVFKLYRMLLEDDDPERLLSLYPAMYNALALPLEARLYYGFNYLRLLARVEREDVPSRRAQIQADLEAIQDPAVAELFVNELDVIELAQRTETSAQAESFRALTGRLKQSRDNVLLRKVMHVRAIQVLGEANQFRFMELLSRHWVTTTNIDEMAFVPVAEQYASITVNKAYGMLVEGAPERAYPTFYSAIRQTNDLEAHYQFVTLGLDPTLDRRDNLERSYAILRDQGLLGDNGHYVKALRALIEADPGDAQGYRAALETAAAELEKLQSRGLSPAIKELLQGYVDHEMLRLTQDRYALDTALFEQAHHHYMLALDLGFDNGRVLAATYENLGWLHFRVRNYALAAGFLRDRLELPFADAQDERSARWMAARAFFFNQETEAAKGQAEEALALAQEADVASVAPFREKAAFYALQAEAWDEAIRHYERLLNDQAATLSAINRAKAELGLGYARVQRAEPEAARGSLQAVLEQVPDLEPQPASNQRLIPFQPRRLELLSLGLLAGLATDPAERAELLARRIQILEAIKGEAETFAYQETDRLAFIVKAQQQRAAAFESLGRMDALQDAAVGFLETARRWSKAADDPAGPVIHRSLVNYLALGVSHPQLEAPGWLDDQVEAAREALRNAPYAAPAVIAKEAELGLLWSAYRARRGEGRFEANAVLRRDRVAGLAADQPDRHATLKQLAAGLEQAVAGP